MIPDAQTGSNSVALSTRACREMNSSTLPSVSKKIIKKKIEDKNHLILHLVKTRSGQNFAFCSLILRGLETTLYCCCCSVYSRGVSLKLSEIKNNFF